jgi:hypothetical protein
MKSSCKVKNPESENPFLRIQKNPESFLQRIQNPRILFQEYFAKNPEESRILFAKNPESRIFCEESILHAAELLLMGGEMMSKKKEQEQDGELGGGAGTQDQETVEDEQILELWSCFGFRLLCSCDDLQERS